MGILSLKNENLSFMLDDGEFKTMKNQYKILIITTIIRLLNNSWYVFTNIN